MLLGIWHALRTHPPPAAPAPRICPIMCTASCRVTRTTAPSRLACLALAVSQLRARSLLGDRR